ncbi:hypothetical protein K2Q16_01550 [Patescibacteria group bacterium]|nr:hypothetical protein [Patescibacteria group bacterium]
MKNFVLNIISPLVIWYAFYSGAVETSLQAGNIPLDFPGLLLALKIIEWSFVVIAVSNALPLLFEHFFKDRPQIMLYYRKFQTVTGILLLIAVVCGFLFLGHLGLSK